MKNLIEVLTEQGIETEESSNGRRVAKCPFHEGDRDPSFTIYPNETYWCFGCHVWGNPVKFLVDYKGMTSAQALEYVGVDFKFIQPEKRVIKVKNLVSTSKFLYDVAIQYHTYMESSPGPWTYLRQRGLTDYIIRKYKIGYTDGGALNYKFAHEYEMASEVGLLNKAGYEALSHRIVIPNIIEDRYCDFMIGRTVINDKIKYLGLRMPKPIMGFFDVRHSPIIFLVEGQFDWLMLRQWDYPSVVLSGSHLSRTNLSLISNKQVVYVPDNDEVGRKAGEAIKRQIPSAIILNTTSLDTKDISEAAMVVPNAKEAFDDLVREQVWPTLLSTQTYRRWLPDLNTMQSLPSI